MQDPFFHNNVVECAKRAVLCDITPKLNAVTIQFTKKSLLLRGYFETGATDDDKEELDHALTVIAAELWKEIEEFYFEAVTVQNLSEMKCLKEWIYVKPELQTNSA